MRHNISIEGLAFRLRPLADSDATFVMQLRNNPDLNRFLHATPLNIANQLAWQERYYERLGDWYFVLERRSDGKSEGLISLYDYNAEYKTAEWGRWVLRPGSLGAVESAWLIYQCAFERLDLNEVYCRTVASNRSVVSFHDSCGIPTRSLLTSHFHLDGCYHDAVEHRITQNAWGACAPRLEKLAQQMARRL